MNRLELMKKIIKELEKNKTEELTELVNEVITYAVLDEDLHKLLNILVNQNKELLKLKKLDNDKN
jgi:hypothetical protein